MITVQIDEDVIKDLLKAELDKWSGLYGTERELLEDYLDEYVDNGWLDPKDFDPSVIVDNLYVNYSRFVSEDEDDWKELGIDTDHQDERVWAVKDGVALVIY